MEVFSHIDWLTLLVGMIIGIPITYFIGMLAILHAPRLVQFLDKRKLIKQTKTKKQALEVFNNIKSFREGRRDRYAIYIILASCAIICAIIASTLFLIISIQNGDQYPISIGYGIVVLFAVAAISAAVVFLSAIYETARQIDRFEDYKVEFEKRWGSID